MLQKVRQSIQKESLFTPGMRIVVAVSGGADSACLLHLLGDLREEYHLDLIAVHLNHGFRGEEAEEDARYVQTLADTLNIEAVIRSIDVPAMKARRHLSAQEAAREARHALLKTVMAERNADRIALGHTRDDRVETVLGNLLRGTGLDGLTAMPPQDLPLIRPLYEISRAETHAYCEAHNLQPRQDSSNQNLRYRRNRIRLELLPELREHYNSEIDAALLRLAEIASADTAYLEAAAQDAKIRCTISETPTAIVLDKETLATLPLALRRRVLRQAIMQIRGSLNNIGFETIEEYSGEYQKNSPHSRLLPIHQGESVRLTHTANQMIIERLVPAASLLAWEIPLTVPGRTTIPQAKLVIETEILPFDERREPMSGLRFPLSEIALPLLVRSRRNGDRITWGKPHGTSKIQDILTDYKIPKEQRDTLPIIVDNTGKILGVGSLKHHVAALTPHSLLPPDAPILEIRAHRDAESET